MLLLLTAYSPVDAAPAPRPRPIIRGELVGEWRFTWNEGDSPALLTLHPCGAWVLLRDGHRGNGTWELDGDFLRINEEGMAWAVRLRRSGRSFVGAGGAPSSFALRR